MLADYSLWALFLSAFISSTLLPGGSEAILAYLGNSQSHPALILVIVASAGNTLGGILTWGMGWLVALRYPVQKLSKKEHLRALGHIQHWGSPALLLSWLPVIGDPLCLVAGWLRISFPLSLFFIAVGKSLRYLAVLYVFA